MRNPVVAYVTICAHCVHEQYFSKQAQANAVLTLHRQLHPTHAVRVVRVKRPGRPTRQRSV
jgi:hypothetical protein